MEAHGYADFTNAVSLRICGEEFVGFVLRELRVVHKGPSSKCSFAYPCGRDRSYNPGVSLLLGSISQQVVVLHTEYREGPL